MALSFPTSVPRERKLRVPGDLAEGAPRWLGLINGRTPSEIPPASAADVRNIVPGTIRKRQGIQKHLTSAVSGSIQGIWPYYQQGSGDRYLVWAANGTLYHGDRTIIASGRNAAGRFEFTQIKDVLYYVTGSSTDGFRYWDGMTEGKVSAYSPGSGEDQNELADPSSAIHSARYVATYQNHVFLAGSDAIPFRVWPSDLSRTATVGAKIDYFPTPDAMDFQSSKGGKITGLVAGETALLVTKDDSVWGVFGKSRSDFAWYQLVPDVGCPSGRAAAYLPGLGFVFLGTDGHVYRLDPRYGLETRYALKRLTAHIPETIASLAKPHLSGAAMGVRGNYLWVAVPTGANTDPSMILVADITKVMPDPWGDPTAEFVPWSIYTYPTSIGTVFSDWDDGTNQYFLAGNTAGMLYRLDVTGVYNDDGAAISAYWKSSPYVFARFETIKRVPFYHLEYQGVKVASTLKHRVFVDGAAASDLAVLDMQGTNFKFGAAQFGSANFGARRAALSKRIPVNKRGRQFQLYFKNDGLDEEMEILSYAITFEEVRLT